VELNRNRSGLVTRQTIIAYWLIPSEPAHTFFQRIINDLARRYNAPVFEPHVTIHVGADRADAASQVLAGAADESKPVTLQALGIGHSDEFIKTLFVELTLSPALQRLHQIARRVANDSRRYQLKPHLSLLYKKITAEARRQLSGSVRIPFSEITFDAVKAIRCSSPTQTRADVEAWRLVATRMLSPQ
jgi:2'-5' RNA ligase